ncbi:MAG: DUF2911 domain-containing protein [Bacteroidota bacterium]
MKPLSTFCLLQLLTTLAFAQYQIGLVPRVSPDKAVYQKVGYTEVRLTYGSPSVQNRAIWGELVPYDKVWRAGANQATTVEFGTEVSIQDQKLDSGTYALFLIPKANDEWTAIFSRKAKQWGAFRYDPEDDALRVSVRPRRSSLHTESLSYAIEQFGFQHGSIVLAWVFMEITIPFETNYLHAFEQEVQSRAGKQPPHLRWVVYLQGAEHLEQINARLDLASQWINQAESIMRTSEEWNPQFYPRDYVQGHVLWTKANVLAKQAAFAEAVSYVEQLKQLPKAQFYERQNEAEGIDDRLEAWRRK